VALDLLMLSAAKEIIYMSTQRIGTVTADALNVRPTPSTDQEPVAVLHRGTVVPVLSETATWVQISIPGGTGYVAAQFLQVASSEDILLPDLFSGDANGHPDWTELAQDPRFFGAIIKALEGVSFPSGQAWFSQHWPALKKAGGDRYGKTWFRGCYHYLIMKDDGAQQAQSYLSTVAAAGGWDNGDLLPIVDVERGQEGSSNFGASKQQVIDVTSKWAETVKAALGRKILLYGRGAMRDLGITDHMGADFLWAPQYNHVLNSTSNIGWPTELVKLWQYTDGNVNFTANPTSAPGIGNTDMSLFLGSLDDLLTLVSG
jgi:GH25 family lysozyme M1 (1,4-beta-N-acetylmuramidase)